jgi:predicted ArsR family transcriptional regulator
MKPELFNSSRGQILKLLRRAPHSVNDLASALDVTDNAVRENLAKLQRDGFVRQTGRRASLRKPEAIYDITPEAERLFTKAYAPVLETLMAVFESHLDEKELDNRLREVGRKLAAPHLPAMKGLSLEKRAKMALRIVEDLGGLAELEQRGQQAFVIGFGCPFSESVKKHPKLCIVVEALVGTLLGREVQEQCQRGERSRCCFLVD